MSTWPRCALFAGHDGDHAIWAHLPDTAEPRNGTRCTHRAEPRVQHWIRPITHGQLIDEDRRRPLIEQAREVAASHGYRGRVSFARLSTKGVRDLRLYVIRVGVKP